MKSGGNNLYYFFENKLTKLANLVGDFKRMICFVCMTGGLDPLGPSLATPLSIPQIYNQNQSKKLQQFTKLGKGKMSQNSKTAKIGA